MDYHIFVLKFVTISERAMKMWFSVLISLLTGSPSNSYIRVFKFSF